MFWERYYNLCDEKGEKPNPVASKLGISSPTVTKWKNGTMPNGDNLAKIAKYFNVSVDYLLGLETVSEEIKTARERTLKLIKSDELLIHDIEERLGVNYATIRSWANGRGDYFNDKLYQIADLFSISVDYLLGRTDNPYQQIIRDDDAVALNAYQTLNLEGKAKTIDYINDLIANPKYTAEPNENDGQDNMPVSFSLLPSFKEIYEEQENKVFRTDRLGDDGYERYAAFGSGVWKEKKDDDEKGDDFDKK